MKLALTPGASAAAHWLATLGIEPSARWFAEISLSNQTDTRFEVNIYAEEWGFAFHHAARASWIRLTDIAFVHGRDDYKLLDDVPELLDIGALIGSLERTHDIELPRASAEIRTNLAGAERAIRAWLARQPGISPRRRTREL